MTISKVLDQTVRMYRANFSPLVILGAIYAVMTLPLIFLDGKPHGGVTMAQVAVPFALAAVLGLLVMVPFQTGAASHASVTILAGERPRVSSSLAAAWRRLGAMIGYQLLAGLAGGLACLLFLFPGFYVWFGFAFSVVIMMDGERQGAWPGVLPAMRRSWRLAKGLRGRLFGVFLVWALLAMVVQFGVSGLLGLVGIGGLVQDLCKQLSSMFITPCHSLSVALIFAHARTEREGVDLAREAERLAQAAPPAPSLQPDNASAV
jgi:hypothetical protein